MLLFLAIHAAIASGRVPPGVARPAFSWDTLPVYFHSANSSGEPWSDEAIAAISRYPMATMEKAQSTRLPNGSTIPEEVGAVVECNRINKASGGKTATFWYLNSIIDWPFPKYMHDALVRNATWRMKDALGKDMITVGGNWGFNFSQPGVTDFWVSECVNAVKGGCTGCFIDRSNPLDANFPPQKADPVASARLKKDHLAALAELDAQLSALGPHYAINNNNDIDPSTTIMIEDFAGTEECINVLQKVAGEGRTVQAHAGDVADGGPGPKSECIEGGINSMAVFLIGAGKYSFYHCSPGWGSDPKWPSVPDYWLDWLPLYDKPLGEPLGLGSKDPNDGLWKRAFKSGTKVAFDPRKNFQNGTITWADGTVSRGRRANASVPYRSGCAWGSYFHGR